jgi:flagellar protein FlbD
VIQVTRFNGTQYYLNAELIQTIESTPDTVITLTDGVKVVVHETADQLIQEIIEYRRKLFSNLPVQEHPRTGTGD